MKKNIKQEKYPKGLRRTKLQHNQVENNEKQCKRLERGDFLQTEQNALTCAMYDMSETREKLSTDDFDMYD